MQLNLVDNRGRAICHENRGQALKIFGAAMVRNEIDLIDGFLSYNLNLFDKMLVADMQSSDGTREVIENFAGNGARVECFNFPYLGKYQREVVTALSKRAFSEGADWVFLLDADEFPRVESRDALEAFLQSFGSDCVHLPWLNLIPSAYGTFSHFDIGQEFFWSGRLSHYKKVAISAQYALTNPGYVVEAGNHNVRPSPEAAPEVERVGFPIMHVPVRSAERSKHKASVALDVQKRKHNPAPGEGGHHRSNHDALAGGPIDAGLLNGVAQNYGAHEPIRSCDPKTLNWPRIRIDLPADFHAPARGEGLEPTELRKADMAKNWKAANFPSAADVSALIDGGSIRLAPQSVRGDGSHGPQIFTSLSNDYAASRALMTCETLSSAIEASFLEPPVRVFSAWTDLVPFLGALIAVAKPRRFVELGVHNGMSFFSACQRASDLGLGIECVAIDSWEGDPHAGFHESKVFTEFLENLRERYPSQMYVRSYFDEASEIFEERSIDLLHIDGFHSYEAVKGDFEKWLPKMSGRGVMIFHDTNVHERGFGVWRFWEGVSQKYMSFELYHGHGLGVLYVGDDRSDVADVFRFLTENVDTGRSVKRYFEALDRMKKLAHAAGTPAKGEASNSSPTSAHSMTRLSNATTALLTSMNGTWWHKIGPVRNIANKIRKIRGQPKIPRPN